MKVKELKKKIAVTEQRAGPGLWSLNGSKSREFWGGKNGEMECGLECGLECIN